MINQHKINMAIDERIDRVYNELNDKIKELETNQLNLQELSTKLCYKLDKVNKRLDKLRALTKVVEMNADDINDIEDEQRIFFTKYRMLESQLKSTIGDK